MNDSTDDYGYMAVTFGCIGVIAGYVIRFLLGRLIYGGMDIGSH